jgi:hypothetical protein
MAENRAALWLIDLSPGKEICPTTLGINVHSGLKKFRFSKNIKNSHANKLYLSTKKGDGIRRPKEVNQHIF